MPICKLKAKCRNYSKDAITCNKRPKDYTYRCFKEEKNAKTAID